MTVVPLPAVPFVHPEQSPEPRTIGDHTWRAKAACQDNTDVDLFFPDGNGSAADQLRIEVAKRLCACCPVRLICLDDALDNGERTGIWGGLTEEERKPAHDALHLRLDQRRLDAAWSGRSVHLSRRERAEIVAEAHRRETSIERVARMLNVTMDHAEYLLREERKKDAAGRRGRARRWERRSGAMRQAGASRRTGPLPGTQEAA